MLVFGRYKVVTVNPENFAIILFFANSVKIHICTTKKSRLGHDLPISVNDRLILEGFYFHEISHMGNFAKIKPSRKFPIYIVKQKK